MAPKKKTSRSVRPTGRPAPVVAKSGVTKNGKRRFGCGGKLK